MRNRNAGFTLIELILVMALIGILAVVGIGSYSQATVKSKDTNRKNDLNQISKALELFNNDLGRYPYIDLVSGDMTCPDEYGDEVSCFGGIRAFIGDKEAVYMDPVPTDSSASREYVYVPTTGGNGFSLYAALENLEDKDVVTEGGVRSSWDPVSCGSVMCNYKITETGLIKAK